MNAAFQAVIDGEQLSVPFRLPSLAELLAEWRRRRDQCQHELVEAQRAGDLERYRSAKARWLFFQRRR
jgi:hypothetical protein